MTGTDEEKALMKLNEFLIEYKDLVTCFEFMIENKNEGKIYEYYDEMVDESFKYVEKLFEDVRDSLRKYTNKF